MRSPFHLYRSRQLRLTLFLAVLVALPAARAMSVIPPTFAELVAEAETVVRGVVSDVRTEEFDSPQGRGVRTLVTLKVERALKGTPGATLTLSLLGGTVGRHTLRVAGMPTFEIGKRELVFVARNGTVMCPLIGAGHGRYHVQTDTTAHRDYITRDNLAPLTSTDEIRLPLDTPAAAAHLTSAADALTLAAFETQIAEAVTRTEAVSQRP